MVVKTKNGKIICFVGSFGLRVKNKNKKYQVIVRHGMKFDKSNVLGTYKAKKEARSDTDKLFKIIVHGLNLFNQKEELPNGFTLLHDFSITF